MAEWCRSLYKSCTDVMEVNNRNGVVVVGAVGVVGVVNKTIVAENGGGG